MGQLEQCVQINITLKLLMKLLMNMYVVLPERVTAENTTCKMRSDRTQRCTWIEKYNSTQTAKLCLVHQHLPHL